jgi:hypothetical protein
MRTISPEKEFFGPKGHAGRLNHNFMNFTSLDSDPEYQSEVRKHQSNLEDIKDNLDYKMSHITENNAAAMAQKNLALAEADAATKAENDRFDAVIRPIKVRLGISNTGQGTSKALGIAQSLMSSLGISSSTPAGGGVNVTYGGSAKSNEESSVKKWLIVGGVLIAAGLVGYIGYKFINKK